MIITVYHTVDTSTEWDDEFIRAVQSPYFARDGFLDTNIQSGLRQSLAAGDQQLELAERDNPNAGTYHCTVAFAAGTLFTKFVLVTTKSVEKTLYVVRAVTEGVYFL